MSHYVVVFTEDQKYVTVDGVKYIKCRRRTTFSVPKCRKEYMVKYRKRKNEELSSLRQIVDEQNQSGQVRERIFETCLTTVTKEKERVP